MKPPFFMYRISFIRDHIYYRKCKFFSMTFTVNYKIMTVTSMSVHFTFYIVKRVQRNAQIQVNQVQKKS